MAPWPRLLACIALSGAIACATADSTNDADAGRDPDAAVAPPDAATPAIDGAPTPDAPPPQPDAASTPCGNSVIDALETCDDGGAVPNDGCSATCQIEPYYHCTGEPSVCTHISIAYAPTEEDDPTYRAAIAAITGGIVDYVDPRTASPSLATLQGYDCVYTWANSGYADSVGFGDALADYVDGGGSVVLGVFTTYTTGNSLGGRIMTAGYSPVTSPTGTNHGTSSSYAGDGTTFLHDSVMAYECQYRDYLALQGTGVQDGSYADGEIAHAYRPDFKVVYSNGSGDVVLGCTGDWARLIANACAAGYLPAP